MLEDIFAPYSDWGLLILRVGIGVLMLFHGWPKLNPNGPMKGPAGLGGFLKQMGVPLPTFFAWVVALMETVGAILLIIGLGTRILAVGFVIDMLVAIRLVKMNMAHKKFSEQDGTGWEFEFILAIASLALIFTGAGTLALDAVLGL